MPEHINPIQQIPEELVSEEVKDIISYRPHWFIRYGNILFLFLILFILLITYFIKYPDIVPGSVRIVAINAPKLVNARTEGKLEKLLVANEQEVKHGQYLAFIESTARHDQVLMVKEWLDKLIQSSAGDNIWLQASNSLPQFEQLGDLQDAYQNFRVQLFESKQTFANGFYGRKKDALQKDLQYLGALKNYAIQQQGLQEEDWKLQKNEYAAYESLKKDKVIAPLELNQYMSKLLSKEQSIEQTKVQIANSEIAKSNKLKEILELQKLSADKQQAFYSSLLNLKSEIEKWIQQYIVVAPDSGKVLFKSSIQENQLITLGEELFYIQSEQAKFYGELMTAQRGLGKMKNGQKVIIKVDSYPSDEFGYVLGKVSYISSIPNRRDSFLVKIDLPKGLQTNYHQMVYFRNNLSAHGDVITDERSLLSRFLGQLVRFIER